MRRFSISRRCRFGLTVSALVSGHASSETRLPAPKAVGEPAVIVEGIPGFYPRFGFDPAVPLGFISPDTKIPDDAFMVKRLPGYSPDLAGQIVYPEAFDVLAH